MTTDELILPRTMRRGDRGQHVRRIQEWLVLNELAVSIDGAFGPATEAAVRTFQTTHHLPGNGQVTARTFEALTKGMSAVLSQPAMPPTRLGSAIVARARQHLAQHPREVGGENAGPWVRLYLDGREGPDWPWCAGFVSFLMRQACETLTAPLPMPLSFSCDVLAMEARDRGLLVPGAAGKPAGVRSGAFFLVRRTASDWTHVGVVIRLDQDTMVTIEGNTNDSGSREGYEVCQRIRNYAGKDYVAWQ